MGVTSSNIASLHSRANGGWSLDMPTLADQLLRVITPPVQVQLHPDLSSRAEHWDVFKTQPWQPSNTLSLIQLGISPFHWQAPATFPRLDKIQLLSKDTTWIITIKSSTSSYVTILDVCEGIYDHFNQNMLEEEFDALSPRTRERVLQWYLRNRPATSSSQQKPEALQRGDLLRSRTVFGGLKSMSTEVLRPRWGVWSFPGAFELLLDVSKERISLAPTS